VTLFPAARQRHRHDKRRSCLAHDRRGSQGSGSRSPKGAAWKAPAFRHRIQVASPAIGEQTLTSVPLQGGKVNRQGPRRVIPRDAALTGEVSPESRADARKTTDLGRSATDAQRASMIGVANPTFDLGGLMDADLDILVTALCVKIGNALKFERP